MQNTKLVAKCEDLKLKGGSASERGDRRGHDRCEQWPARESKEERQLLIYQADRSFARTTIWLSPSSATTQDFIINLRGGDGSFGAAIARVDAERA